MSPFAFYNCPPCAAFIVHRASLLLELFAERAAGLGPRVMGSHLPHDDPCTPIKQQGQSLHVVSAGTSRTSHPLR
ncbi:hypothetical protein BgiMline_004928, partial [Biomphalaria glabrata]